MPTVNGQYVASGTFHDAPLSDSDRKKVESLQRQWKTTDDPAERARLHNQAEDIRSGYGYSGGGDGSEFNAVSEQRGGYEPADRSGFLHLMQNAATKSRIDALMRAQGEALGALDEAKDSVAPRYAQARNAVRGQSDQARRNFQEYAAAQGFGSGATAGMVMAGQAATQGQLGALAREEAAALADIERQRTHVVKEYAARMAEAESLGQTELAQALYREAVRLDTALADRAMQQQSFNQQLAQWRYQAARDTASDGRNAAEDAYRRSLDEFDRRMKEEQLALQKRRVDYQTRKK